VTADHNLASCLSRRGRKPIFQLLFWHTSRESFTELEIRAPAAAV